MCIKIITKFIRIYSDLDSKYINLLHMIMQEERIHETFRLSHKGYCNAQRPNWQSCFNRDNLFYDPTIYRCNLYLHHLCSNEQFDVMYLSLFAISLNKYFPVLSIFLSEGNTKVLKSPCKIR